MIVYKGRLPKNLQIENQGLSCQHWSLHGFQTWHFICNRFGCKTFVAINSESRLTLFPTFCAPPSEVAVLFYSNLSGCPFLRQVIDLDLLLCTAFDSEHAVFSETNDWYKDWAKRWALLWLATTSCQSHRKFHFTWNKKWLVAALYLQSIKTFWVTIARVVACFPQASLLLPAATTAYSETPCVCACPSDPPALPAWESCPKSLVIDFAL